MKKPLPPYDPVRMAEALRAGCDACGVQLGAHAVTQLDGYARLLRDGSTRMNLTAILDDAGIGVRHFADSLSVLPLLLEEAARVSGRTEPFTVLDVGSGAGLPGIPLRIALDELSLTKKTGQHSRPAPGPHSLAGRAGQAGRFSGGGHPYAGSRGHRSPARPGRGRRARPAPRTV